MAVTDTSGNVLQTVCYDPNAYTAGNPVNFVDPSGLSKKKNKRSNRKTMDALRDRIQQHKNSIRSEANSRD